MSKEGLTKEDSLFVDEYFNNGFNATRAYMSIFNVEYKTAKARSYKLMCKPLIKLEVEKRWKEIEDAAVIKRQEIMFSLKELLYDSMERKDNTTLLKTIDIINKMSGAYVTQIEANVNHSIKLNIPGIEEKNDDDI